MVFGVGNPWCGDDALGPWLARHLQGRVSEPVWDVGETPESYLQRVPTRARLLLVDAVDFGGRPGEARLFDPRDGAGADAAGMSTHRLPLRLLADYLHLSRGAETFLLGVQPRDTGWGVPISAAVQEACQRLLEWLPAWIAAGCPLPGEE